MTTNEERLVELAKKFSKDVERLGFKLPEEYKKYADNMRYAVNVQNMYVQMRINSSKNVE